MTAVDDAMSSPNQKYEGATASLKEFETAGSFVPDSFTSTTQAPSTRAVR